MNIRFSLVLLCTLWGASSGCEICGTDMMVGNEDGVVVIQGRGNRTCAELQTLGDSGIITDEQCAELQPFVQEPCECKTFICEICGPDGISTDPGGIVDIPGDGQGLTTCAAVFQVAQRGGFNQTFCPSVQAVVEEPCGCERGSPEPSAAPTAPDQPTREPTRRPTRAPTPQPTASPPSNNGSAGNTPVVWVALAGAFMQPLFNMFW